MCVGEISYGPQVEAQNQELRLWGGGSTGIALVAGAAGGRVGGKGLSAG